MRSTEIDDLWQQMERTTAGHGLLRRRLAPLSSFDLFVTVDKPSNTRGVQLQVHDPPESIEEPLPRVRGMHLAVQDVSSPPHHASSVEIRLGQKEFGSIFAVLASDLMDTVIRSSSGSAAVDALLGRLHSWQRFMERYSPEGLSAEAQRGLYGEVYFLMTHLEPAVGPSEAVRAWTGPDLADQDFQLQHAAVEVKTTSTAKPQQLSISSERQLDGSGLVALGLFHVSLDVRAGTGQTLNDLVDEARERLGGWSASRVLFEDALIKVGYLEPHRERYASKGYRVREENLFAVVNGFPRLVEADLPEGVGNVRYTITLSGCSSFKVDIPRIKEFLTGGCTDT